MAVSDEVGLGLHAVAKSANAAAQHKIQDLV